MTATRAPSAMAARGGARRERDPVHEHRREEPLEETVERLLHMMLFVDAVEYTAPISGEPKFVEQWLAAVRGSADPIVREANILIRPHPSRGDGWHTPDLTEFRNVALFGSHPVDAAAKNDYFDSFAHAAAVAVADAVSEIASASPAMSSLPVCWPWDSIPDPPSPPTPSRSRIRHPD